MTRRTLYTLFIGALTVASLGSGCIRSQRLQYDYSRSYNQATTTQADLTRATAKDGQYSISGIEGMALRAAVVTETTDAESGTAEVIDE